MITKLILSIALAVSVLGNIGQYEVYKSTVTDYTATLQSVVIDRADWCKRNKEAV